MRRIWRSARGQTLIEFALVTPIIVLFLVAIIDFGMAMDRRIILQHAAREGARAAAVNDNMSQVCQRIMDESHNTVARPDVRFSYDDLDHNGQYNAGDNVKVTLPYHWDLPILNSALPGLFHLPTIDPVSLTATASARLERTVPGTTRCQ